MQTYLVIDGQWGSTGKGAIAGYLARKRKPDGMVCNFGPNAGHTFVFDGGSRVMTRQLPSGIVSDSVTAIFIGPGSIIDPEVLESELKQFEHFIGNHRIYIHERAAVVNEDNRMAERSMLRHISSTCKGTGSAMVSKTMRMDTGIARHYKGSPDRWTQFICSHDVYTKALLSCNVLQIESAQGFELGNSSGSHYPYCTGRDITPAQVLADCGVPVGVLTDFEVIATMRTFPIRVGDQYDAETGEKVGTSGPVYSDQREVTFAEIGVPDEHTTVTGKKRRIFTFSDHNAERMIRSCMPRFIFLNFANYVSDKPTFDDLAVAGYVKRMHAAHVAALGKYAPVDFVRWIGTGPEESHIFDYHDHLRGILS